MSAKIVSLNLTSDQATASAPGCIVFRNVHAGAVQLSDNGDGATLFPYVVAGTLQVAETGLTEMASLSVGEGTPHVSPSDAG